MRGFWKKCVAGLLLAAVIAGGAGCRESEKGSGEVPEMTEMVRSALTLAGADMQVFSEESPKPSEKRLMQAAEYLEKTLMKKYPGAAFEMTGCVKRGLNQPYDVFVLQPAGQPEKEFTARVTETDTGYVMTDSWYGVMKTTDFEEYIAELIKECEPQAQVISTIDFQFSEECGASMPIMQGVRQPEFFSFTWILIPAGDKAFEERAAAVWAAIEADKLDGDYALYLMPAGAAQMSREEALEKIYSHTDKQPVYEALARRTIR